MASRVPCGLRARQERAAWWARISTGAFSVRAKSMSWTCPDLRPKTRLKKYNSLFNSALGNQIRQSTKWGICNSKNKIIYYLEELVRNWYCLDIEYTNHMNSYKFQIHVTAVEFEWMCKPASIIGKQKILIRRNTIAYTVLKCLINLYYSIKDNHNSVPS